MMKNGILAKFFTISSNARIQNVRSRLSRVGFPAAATAAT